MAHSKSAKKRIKQNESARLRNRGNRSALRTQLKKVRQAVADKKSDEATKLLPQTTSLIDVMVKKGVIHGNTGSRYKSRLAKSVATLS